MFHTLLNNCTYTNNNFNNLLVQILQHVPTSRNLGSIKNKLFIQLLIIPKYKLFIRIAL